MPVSRLSFSFPALMLITGFLSPLSYGQAPATTPAPHPDPAAYVKFGIEQAAANNLAGATDAFNQALKLDPNWAPAYDKLGLILYQQNQFADAIKDFDKALQIDASYQDVYLHRALAKGGLNQFPAAIDDLTHLIQLNPKYPGVYLPRGMARYFINDFDGSIADATQALTLDPKLANAYFYRGLSRRAKGDKEGQVDDFEKSATYGSAYGAFWHWVAQNENSEEGPARAVLSDYLGKFQVGQDTWEKAVGDYLLMRITQQKLLDRAGLDDPILGHTGEAWFFIGVSKRLSGDPQGARDAFQQALATGSKQSVEYAEAPRELSKVH